MKSETRYNVLEGSLTIEKLISSVLGGILDISDIYNSKTLGHKTSSLSFRNKTDLITDLQAMEREEAKKFEAFADIRNQFIHNIEVETFEECFKNIDGIVGKLKKWYPDINITKATKEHPFERYFNALSMDLVEIIHKLFGDILNRKYEQGVEEGKKKMSNFIIESLVELKTESPEIEKTFKDIIKRAEEKSKKDIQNLRNK